MMAPVTITSPLTSENPGHRREAATGIEPVYRALQALAHAPLTRTFTAFRKAAYRLHTIPIAAAVVVALVALVVGCVPADCAPTASIPTGWSWVGPAGAPTVGVVGDSLTYQAEHGSAPDPYYQTHALTDDLNAAGYAARVAARSGADTRSLRMWGQWQTAPDVIVMALGTNDRRWAPTVAPGFPFQLGTSQWNVVPYLGRWPAACVVVVGVVEGHNQWRHDIYGPAWNRWLRYYASLRGGVFVDWWAISSGHPEYFTADRLHHTAAGQAAYRQAITEGVQQCR